MNSNYLFCAENTERVKRFLDLVATQPASKNSWSEYLGTPLVTSRKSQQNELISMLHTDHPPDDQVLQLMRLPYLKKNSIINVDDAKVICDLLNTSCSDENFTYTFEEIYMKCTKEVCILPYLAEHLSEDAAKCFLFAALTKTENPQLIMTIYSDFLLPLTQLRPYTRFLDNILVHCCKSNPEQFYKLFLPMLLNDETVSAEVFNHFAKSLDMDGKKNLLNEIFTFDLSDQQFLLHIPAVTHLYMSTHSDYVNVCMIKMLCRKAELCRKDKNYGKLLLAVIQALESPCTGLDILESLCMIHETVFKTACLNNLSKLRN